MQTTEIDSSKPNRTEIGKHPRVSVLIPTHNRPEYFELALKSVLLQNYPNTEIIVADNSDGNETVEKIKPYLLKYGHIIYVRTRHTTATENFSLALNISTGKYVAHLMDDDLFHPDKISRMIAYFEQNDTVRIATSFRKLIDANGNGIHPIPGTERLFETDTLITGHSFAKYILEKGSNLIGEPTTAIILKEDIPEGFGWFCGRQYTYLSDVATWLSILSKGDCVYLSEAMSYFRIHEGQHQKNKDFVQLRASCEWFQLGMDAYERNLFSTANAEFLVRLKEKLATLVYYGFHGPDANDLPSDLVREISSVVRRGNALIAAA